MMHQIICQSFGDDGEDLITTDDNRGPLQVLFVP